MKVVHKFPISRELEVTEIEVFGRWKVVHFAWQLGRPCAWIEHQPQEGSSPVKIKLKIVATGKEIPDGWTHHGTCFQDIPGTRVWHLYEIW